MTNRKTMSSSALRKRRQGVKKLRAELKRELREIDAEMASRQKCAAPVLLVTKDELRELYPPVVPC